MNEDRKSRLLQIVPGILVSALFAALISSVWWFRSDLSIVLASTAFFTLYAWLIVIGFRRIRRDKSD